MATSNRHPGISAEQHLNHVRYSDTATTLDIARAEFDVWYEKEAMPAYQRLVDLEKSIKGNMPKIQEKVEILDGSRNLQSRGKAAVRFEDMRFLQDLPSIPPTARKAIGASVTVAEYNALVDDVARLYQALGSIAMLVSQKLR